MRINIDTTRCTGHGMCEVVAEDLFEVGPDGMTHLLGDPGPDRRGEIEAAVAECPTRALSVDL